MSKPFYWFPCEPSPLLGALAGMRPSEGYVYTIILLRIYESGGVCRDSVECLATRTKFKKNIVADALDSLLKSGRLYRSDDGIRNPKADGTIAEAQSIFQNRLEHSSKAAKARWEKNKQNQQTTHARRNARAMPGDTQLESQLQLQEDSPLIPPSGGTRKRASKGSALPDDWKPKETHYAKGAALGFSISQIDAFAERMRNWAGANAHRPVARKSNWDFAFHNWISDKAERNSAPAFNGGATNATNRAGGNLGAAGIAATLRRTRDERARDQAAFIGDAGDPIQADRHRHS